LPLRTLRLVTGALDFQAPLRKGGVVMGFQLLDRERCGLERRRAQQAGCGVRALISDAQCRSFSQGATCLVEFSTEVGFEARLNGGKCRPVDETFMLSGKQHGPLFQREMSDSPSDRALLVDIALLASLNVGAGIDRVAEHIIDAM
jgi:hypothetical protein